MQRIEAIGQGQRDGTRLLRYELARGQNFGVERGECPGATFQKLRLKEWKKNTFRNELN